METQLYITFFGDEGKIIPLLLLHKGNKLVAKYLGLSVEQVQDYRDNYSNLLRELELASAVVISAEES